MKPTHRLRFLLIQTSAALALLVNHATAATFTWDGSASTSWNTATNWVLDSAPGTGGNTADVIIAGTSNVATILLTTTGTYTLRSLTFDATNDANTRLVLAGAATTAANTRPLTFSSDSGNATLTVDADSTGNKTIDRNEGAATINLTSSLDVIHNGSGTLTLGNSTNTSNLGGAGGINKSGTGTLVLASVNNYTGATTITGGSLQVGAGSTAGRLTATTAITNNSNLTINRSDAFSQAADLGVGVAITGTGSFTQAGAGTTTLTAANTYTGTTLISKGRLQFAKAVSLYNGATASLTAADLIVASGAMAAFNVGGTGEFTSGNLDALTALGGAASGFQSGSSIGLDTSSGDFSHDSVIANPNGGSNALSLTKLGINTLTLIGNNTFSGGVIISASSGKVIAGHNNALGSGTVALAGQAAVLELADGITVSNAMTVSASGNPKTIVLQSGATSATYSGNIVNSEETSSNFDLSATTGGTLTISGIISPGISTAGLEKVGAGNVTLTAANTYTGGTTVTSGTLSLGNGDTTGRLTATTAIVNNSNLTINRSDAFSQATDLGAGVLISGAGGFTQAGAGITTLTAANTYTGVTTIKNGTLALDGDANRLAVAGAVVLGDTGTTGKLVLGGTTTAGQTLTALTTTGLGGSVVGGNASNSTLTLNIASSNTFAGTLGGAGTNENKLALTKTGAGTLTLSNTANTFTGQVLSDSGTIQVTKLENIGTASSVGAGAAAIRLGSTATATLEYTGTTDSSTNRQIQVGSFADNAFGATILNNSSSGKLTFTNANFISQASEAATQARVLTIGGSYTGAANEIQGVIRDNLAAAVSLTKTGASTWQLSGANTYTGATTVTAGTLAITSGSSASPITVNSAAVLELSVASPISSTASLTLDDGSTVSVTGSPTLSSYTLLTAASINGTPVLAAPVAGYVLVKDGNSLVLNQESTGPGPVDHFVISAISSPQTVGTPITGITITAQDASNATATSFTGTVTFSGTGGFTGTSASFTAGVLNGVSVTPTVSGPGLTLVVTEGVSGPTGTATITTIQSQYDAWSGGAAFDADTNGDGVKNGLAWILGAANKDASALGLLPAVSTSGGNMLFTFKRNQASINSTALTIDVGTTLATWPDAYNVGTDTAGSTAGVAILQDSPVAGTDTVTLTVTRAPDAKKFARLNATQN